MTTEFRLLGAVEARAGDRFVDLGPPRQRCVLAALLVDVNHVVPADQLVIRVWGDRPPHRARGTLYTYLSRLRRVLTGAGGIEIAHRSGGYLLSADPETVDLHRFRRLVTRARQTRDDNLAGELYDRALTLWRGDAFAALDTPWLAQVRAALDAERRAAELDRNDVELRRGRHGALLAGLTVHAAEHPLDERLAGQLMLALFRAGRQADALRVYRDTRTALRDELGLEPGPELRSLQEHILSADPALAAPSDTGRPGERGVVPRQLPVDIPHFTGREQYLAQLRSALDVGGPRTVVINAISGTAGVGKTALAVHFGHSVADRFPDGQLYLDLRGSAPTAPMTTTEALGWLLRSLGLAAEQIPSGADEQAALYRSLLAGKRVLVLLDNAYSAAQVRPLLPANPGCLVVVTSRSTLSTLDEISHVQLDVLSEPEAVSLLARLAGHGRVDREPEAANTLVSLCARLPLAVRIAGARLAARPMWTIAALVDRLADEKRRLDELQVDDRAVRASFAVTYQGLTTSPPAAQMFRLLGVLDWADMTVPVAAALLDQPQPVAHEALEHLLDAHLLDSSTPGRYQMHDLLRLYARDAADQDEPAPGRQAALSRALECYLGAAQRATLLATSDFRHSGPEHAVSPRGEFSLSTPAEVARWVDDERANLLAAAHQALAAPGARMLAARLASALARPLEIRGHWLDLITLLEAVARYARDLGDRYGEALVQQDLGFAYLRMGRTGAAIPTLEEGLAIWREISDRRGEADSLRFLGFAYDDDGRPEEAIDCHRQALAICRDIGHRYGEAGALNALGLAHQQMNRLDEAIAYHQQALTINREVGNRYSEASALGNLGWAYHRAGDRAQAVAYHQQALALARDVGSRYQEAESLWGLGQIHYAEGQTDQARTCWQHAITILHDIGALTTETAGDLRRQPIPETPAIIERNT